MPHLPLFASVPQQLFQHNNRICDVSCFEISVILIKLSSVGAELELLEILHRSFFKFRSFAATMLRCYLEDLEMSECQMFSVLAFN